jgi:hypothetical protein
VAEWQTSCWAGIGEIEFCGEGKENFGDWVAFGESGGMVEVV